MHLRYFIYLALLLIIIACERGFAPSVEGGYSSKPAVAPIDNDLLLPSDNESDSYEESSPEDINAALEDIKKELESTYGITDVSLDKPIRPNPNNPINPEDTLPKWEKGQPCNLDGIVGEYDNFGTCCTTKNFTQEPEYKCILNILDEMGDIPANDDDKDSTKEEEKEEESGKEEELEEKEEESDKEEELEDKKETEPTGTSPVEDSGEGNRLGEPCDDDNPNAKYDKNGKCCDADGVIVEGECVSIFDII